MARLNLDIWTKRKSGKVVAALPRSSDHSVIPQCGIARIVGTDSVFPRFDTIAHHHFLCNDARILALILLLNEIGMSFAVTSYIKPPANSLKY